MVAFEETDERHHVLVVDDDADIRDFLMKVVERLGFQVTEAPSVPRALKVLSSQSIDLMLLDIYLKGATGLDLIKSLHRRRASVPTVVVSGYISEPVAQQLVKFGVQGLVSKPFRRNRLEEEISQVLSGEPNFLERDDAPGWSKSSARTSGSAPPETERRGSERVSMQLPVKAAQSSDSIEYLRLVNLSASGMKTFGRHPDLLMVDSDTPLSFEIPAVANLAWLHNVRFGDGYVVGWKFDSIIDQYLAAIPMDASTQITDAPAARPGDRRKAKRIAMDQTVLARGPKGKRFPMKLVNISSNGMQTYCEGLDVLWVQKSAPTERVVFDTSVRSRFTWMEPRKEEFCVVGWEFEPMLDSDVSHEEGSAIQRLSETVDNTKR